MVIEEVAKAVRVLEHFAPEGGQLFSARNIALKTTTKKLPPNQAGSQTTHEKLDFANLINKFASWQNSPEGQYADLPSIPEVKGNPYRLKPSQFRRTLARQLAFQPHGTIASKDSTQAPAR